MFRLLLDLFLTPFYATPWSLWLSITTPGFVEKVLGMATVLVVTLGIIIPWPITALACAILYGISLIGRITVKEPDGMIFMSIYALFFGTLLRCIWEILPMITR